MINFVHSATKCLTVVGAIHEVDRRRVRLTTPIHSKTFISLFPSGNGHFPLDIPPSGIFPTVACDGIRQEVQLVVSIKS